MTTAHQLRELAREIERACHDSPCVGIAAPIISNAVDHLCAIARIHELNEEQNAIHNRP